MVVCDVSTLFPMFGKLGEGTIVNIIWNYNISDIHGFAPRYTSSYPAEYKYLDLPMFNHIADAFCGLNIRSSNLAGDDLWPGVVASWGNKVWPALDSPAQPENLAHSLSLLFDDGQDGYTGMSVSTSR